MYVYTIETKMGAVLAWVRFFSESWAGRLIKVNLNFTMKF